MMDWKAGWYFAIGAIIARLSSYHLGKIDADHLVSGIFTGVTMFFVMAFVCGLLNPFKESA